MILLDPISIERDFIIQLKTELSSETNRQEEDWYQNYPQSFLSGTSESVLIEMI